MAVKQLICRWLVTKLSNEAEEPLSGAVISVKILEQLFGLCWLH